MSNTGASILVDYIEPDPDWKPGDKFRFFFSYRANQNGIVEEISFKVGMNFAPQRMKLTMEDIKVKFIGFNENGGGNIKDFLSFMVAEERNEKIEKLGI